MMILGTAELQRLTLRVLLPSEGDAPGADALAAAAHRAYEDLARVTAPLIGHIGVAAITDRALHLAQREYPWLARTQVPAHGEGPFDHVVTCLKRQDPAVAIAAAVAVFATFIGMLVTFIGDPLTTGLLRKAWPDVFSDANTRGRKT